MACWRERSISTGSIVKFDRFEEFVATLPLEGLGTNMDMIKRICSGDNEALDLIDRALKREDGNPTGANQHSAGSEPEGGTVSNIHNSSERPAGTTVARALRKLREDRPDLHAKVIAGESTPHGAMIEAGFRKKTFTVPDDPQGAARTILKHFKGEALAALLKALANGNDSQATN